MVVGSSNKARKQTLLTKLCSLGNYMHNMEVLHSGEGECQLFTDLAIIWKPVAMPTCHVLTALGVIGECSSGVV